MNSDGDIGEILKREFGARVSMSRTPLRKSGSYVLLWVQQAVRVRENHALAAAVRTANLLELPLYAYFGIDPSYPGANARHFAFLFEGLIDLEAALAARGIPLIVGTEQPVEGAGKAAARAACVVGDVGYTRRQRRWRRELQEKLTVPLILLESDAVVPAAQASRKEEYAAATFRPKIRRLTDLFLAPVHCDSLNNPDSHLPPALAGLPSIKAADARANMEALGIDMSVSPVERIRGGEKAAEGFLEEFIRKDLHHYHDARNDPGLRIQSDLSPYLHFGHLSPLRAALRTMEASSHDPSLLEGTAAFLEQLIVRRELAINFCLYNEAYDAPESLPRWARETLALHAQDPRPAHYTEAEIIEGRTEDPYWNAAQKELLIQGKMHGYMRMYWGKKLLEWLPDWREAYRLLVRLNDTYSLDGRDPNGYAGVAWVFGKHDRPFPERPCFGKLRPMGAKGLKRKFEMELYLNRIDELQTS